MTNIERVKMDFDGLFWTRRNEMIEEIESLDYSVYEVTSEYVCIQDLQDEDEDEYILYLGHANTTMWVESVKEAL